MTITMSKTIEQHLGEELVQRVKNNIQPIDRLVATMNFLDALGFNTEDLSTVEVFAIVDGFVKSLPYTDAISDKHYDIVNKLRSLY